MCGLGKKLLLRVIINTVVITCILLRVFMWNTDVHNISNMRTDTVQTSE